jgi:hypothetical protein
LASNYKIGDHWQYIIPKKQGLADALSEKQFLQTLLVWNDVLPPILWLLAKQKISTFWQR